MDTKQSPPAGGSRNRFHTHNPLRTHNEKAQFHLKHVRYWHLDEFRAWMKNALQMLRDIRRDFPGPGNLAWRTAVAEKLKGANISPQELKQMLVKTGADCMQAVTAKEEEVE